MDHPVARPNFLVILTDQMRADHMGCGGNPVIRTPNLDALAAGGVHLSRGYLNNPVCMPSRATLFTGLTPRGHRVRGNGIPLDRATPTVPAVLAEAGYATASMGKIHLSPYTLYPDVPIESAPPQKFPELREHWVNGTINRVPTPYYGLQEVELTIGHACRTHGNYFNWLRQEDPAAAEHVAAAKLLPSPLGAEGCRTFPTEERLHHTAWVANRTIDYLHCRDPAKPFYLMCSFPDPHHPYHVPPPWDRMYSPDEVMPPKSREGELADLPWFMRHIYEKPLMMSGRSLPTKMPEAHLREIIAHTYGMVSLIDKHVGRILAKLDELGLADNTVVVFLSDHGDLMGDHGLLNKGAFHFEGLLRVPMIWRWPGKFHSRRTPALASLLDFAPTVLDLAGVGIPEGVRSSETRNPPPAWPGRSLSPLLTGQADSVQDSVVIENDEDYLGLRLRTLVTQTHKITTYTGQRGPEPYGELFDLANDPAELHNLWNNPSYASLRGELIERLHYRLTETDSALPRGMSHA